MYEEDRERRDNDDEEKSSGMDDEPTISVLPYNSAALPSHVPSLPPSLPSPPSPPSSITYR
jgi:hypothetical protein